MKYVVYVTIRNSYEVEASSKYEAETIVRDMNADEILNDSDFKIEEMEELHNETSR